MAEYTHTAAVTINAPTSPSFPIVFPLQRLPEVHVVHQGSDLQRQPDIHWVADVVGTHEWDAVNENWIDGKQIGWRSTDGLQNHGVVTFEPVGDSQTKVQVTLSYDPPAGALGDVGEKLGAGNHFEQKLQHDLDHFAQLVAQTPSGALDPESSNYLFHEDSAAVKGKTTAAQDATLADNT